MGLVLIPGAGARANLTILTEAAGHVLYEDGHRLVFVNRGTGWTFWLRFVLGLVTFIVGANGVAQLVLGSMGKGFVLAGVILLFVAGLGGAGFVAVHSWVKTQAKRPLTDFPPVVVIDRQTHWLLGPGGEQLAPLNTVVFSPEFQFTSSAPALAACWPGGKRIVHRGGAMGLSGIGGAQDALRARGLRA